MPGDVTFECTPGVSYTWPGAGARFGVLLAYSCAGFLFGGAVVVPIFFVASTIFSS